MQQGKNVIGHRIKSRRDELGMTREEVASKMQLLGHSAIYPETVYKVETKRRRVTDAEVVGFARVLRMAISALLGVPDYE